MVGAHHGGRNGGRIPHVLERLNALQVKRLAKPGYHLDGGGLYLQVTPTGAKSWVFHYTLKGKTREMGLGPLDIVGLAEARVLAREARTLKHEGVDPIEHRKAARVVEVLEDARSLSFKTRHITCASFE
ncbi:Arm DNA-binding domain-containing protein [Caulobacter soli]|uniref:Arm DNA-binding domain-containing protein n=1 Tax=Caulobacter soli TaxID=2708539 RepID=UPI0013EBD59B|nr:Arm DNA-binding domain-containing protein [Caulobacter soli]